MLSRWQKFKLACWNWVKNSGTILWARLQYIIGILAAGLIATFSTYDWTSLASMDLKTAFKMLVAAAISGIITEAVRRKGNTVQTVTVANAATNFQPVEIQRLERTEPQPPPQG